MTLKDLSEYRYFDTYPWKIQVSPRILSCPCRAVIREVHHVLMSSTVKRGRAQ